MSSSAKPNLLDVLADLLDLPPDQRPGHLAQLSLSPEQSAELNRCLALSDQAKAFMEQAPAVALPLADVPPCEASGPVIGNFELLERIGEGGFGVVYVAQQKIPVPRRVAFKIIKLGMDTPAFIARFEAERRAVARMDHPNIAKILDAGATDTGRPYFVMELVHGIPITQYCDANHVTPAARLKLFVQVCSAIEHAHEKCIIHRDLKPSNILVTIDDGFPTPKVIDFGIAKAMQGDLGGKPVYTQFRQFLGTPAYMSPEQREMTSQQLDGRSDIYSLGVLLYELLTGSMPFEQNDLEQPCPDAPRRQIRDGSPPKPSTRVDAMPPEQSTTRANYCGMEIRSLINALRGDLDCIVMKCLEKARSRRYTAARDLAADIQRHLDGKPILARPASESQRDENLLRSRKFVFTLGAAVLLSALLIVWLTHLSARRRAMSHPMGRPTLPGAIRIAEFAGPITGDTWLSDSTLANVTQMETVGFIGHDSGVFCAAFSPDGRLIISAGTIDGKMILWDADTGHALRVFSGHTDHIGSVALSPDSRTALTGSGDKTVRLWDVAAGQELRTYSNQPQWRGPVSFAPDGRTALAAGDDGTNNTFRLFEIATGMEIRSFPYGVTSFQFSPDGQTVLTGSWDNSLRHWRTATGRQIRKFNGPIDHGTDLALPDHVIGVSFSVDGTQALSVSGNCATVWDVSTGEVRRLFKQADALQAAAFSPDGRFVATGGHSGLVKVWDIATGQKVREWQGPSLTFTVAFRPHGKAVLAAGENDPATGYRVVLYDIARLQASRDLEPRIKLAQRTLQQSPHDGPALATMGQWAALHGADDSAVGYLEKSRSAGTFISPLLLGRCYWNLSRFSNAKREFSIALSTSADPAERFYVQLCMHAIDAAAGSMHPATHQ